MRVMAAALCGMLMAAGAGAKALAPTTASPAEKPPAVAMPEKAPTPPPDYRDAKAWICRPGTDDGTCSTGLDAMAVDAAGTRTPVAWKAAAAPAIDCFYIYPTGSDDTTFYSDMIPNRSETRIVHGQAARLGQTCRLFAPVYQQVTSAALRWWAASAGAISFEIPYRDVLAAWHDYLARDNHGRGVVLIGHSQGAILLNRLIAEEIDGKPAQKLLVGAYLAGNIDLTAASFHSVKPCTAPGHLGCVVAWSSYADDDAAPRRMFGGGPRALCVNPAAPGGGRGMLKAFLPRPGIAPESDPPYVEAIGQISAECVADGRGRVLRIRVEPGRYHDLLAAMLRTSRIPGWGLHPLDMALTQGNVADLVAAQAVAWGK